MTHLARNEAISRTSTLAKDDRTARSGVSEKSQLERGAHCRDAETRTGRASLGVPSVFPRQDGEERKQRKRQANEKDEEEEGEETRELYGRDVICSESKTTESGGSARTRI